MKLANLRVGLSLILSLLSITNSATIIKITDLKDKNDFEKVVFKSNKAWLIVIYADWDQNKLLWEGIWESSRKEFEKEELELEMGRLDLVNKETGAPDMGFLKQ